jgi:L-amino acid N-acyltransferase YncA
VVTVPFLQSYPKKIALRDSTPVHLRPLDASDKVRLLKFFERVPEDERHYLKENVTAPEVVHAWTHAIDLQRAIPIVAVAGDEIVADGTLHRSRAPARRHTAEIRLVVDPGFREKGLGSRMIRELVDLAVDLGVHKVFFELADRREQAAILAAKGMGFSEAGVLSEAIRDYWGNLQDLVILELPLKDREFWWRY